MRRRRSTSVAGSPVLIGAIATVVVIVAVFLAYNANKGLPFVPTFIVKVEVPNAERLVVGNEVREGGDRIGQVSAIDPIRTTGGREGAELTLQLERRYAPFPKDTTYEIRAKSTLGLKYVELNRGTSSKLLADGSVVTGRSGIVRPELSDFFGTFDPPTRTNIQRNLMTYGDAFAGRGDDLNRTFRALPPLLGGLVPVMQTLSDPRSDLPGFFTELADFARLTAPVAGQLSEGFTTGANTFEALTRDPGALDQTIAQSPGTLDVANRSLPAQRPLLRALADVAGVTTGTALELRRSAPVLSRALATGTRVLPDTVPLSDELAGSLNALGDLARSPLANLALDGLQTTGKTLNPTLKYLGPHITVCNYWNYFWTFFSDHVAERVSGGTTQRIEVKNVPPQTNGMNSYGATRPADGTGAVPGTATTSGDPVALHAQPYGRAVDAQGNADCEQGQRGYPARQADGAPAGLNVAVDPRTPGDQGPTFTGLPKVPAGETFSAEPAGTAPKVAGP